MKKLLKKKGNQSVKKLPTSIQDQLFAMLNGDTMRFELEDDDGAITFIPDDEEE